jgi:hypothetical protein
MRSRLAETDGVSRFAAPITTPCEHADGTHRPEDWSASPGVRRRLADATLVITRTLDGAAMPLTALLPNPDTRLNRLNTRASPASSLADRLDAQLWRAIEDDLDQRGYALIPGLLNDTECDTLAALYRHDAPFRSRVVMARHGFGSGEYRYFAYPLPDIVAGMRRLLYARLFALANRWAERLGTGAAFPSDHDAYIARCHEAGQTRPTPLLLRYRRDDYNCLHQDLYGEHVFPVQATILLSSPGADFSGGEFVLTEQRARRQSRVEVVPLGKGDAVLFAVRHRPTPGGRGAARATLRHGVSRIREGERYTLGIIFHDAT